MPKKSKPFIDKKNSTTYHLLHRSQRDIVTHDDSSAPRHNILVPAAPPKSKTIMSTLEKKLAQTGLTEYDYSRHLKPIEGTGLFFDGRGAASEPITPSDPRSKLIVEEEVTEVERQLESIALNDDCMDDDIALALFGDFEEGQFEEILDDFCVTAAKTPEESEEEGGSLGGFDFDRHIARLMEQAKKEQETTGVAVEDDFFEGVAPLEKDSFDEDEAVGGVEKLALERQFMETMAEYDSDEVGDLDEECDDIAGFRPLEGDAVVEAAMDQFLRDKDDGFFMGGVVNDDGDGDDGPGSLVGVELAVPTKMERLLKAKGDDDCDTRQQPLQEMLKDADRILANPEMEPPEEDVLIDGKSYFTERTQNPWDCESILTTYSNLDNNPTTIQRMKKTKKKKNKSTEPQYHDDEFEQIKLSNKTGLPLGVFSEKLHDTDEDNDDTDDDDDDDKPNHGEKRRKNESKEEKKARKQALKNQRKEARMQKKMMKDAFKNEFIKRRTVAVVDDVGGRAVFRYS